MNDGAKLVIGLAIQANAYVLFVGAVNHFDFSDDVFWRVGVIGFGLVGVLTAIGFGRAGVAGNGFAFLAMLGFYFLWGATEGEMFWQLGILTVVGVHMGEFLVWGVALPNEREGEPEDFASSATDRRRGG